MPSLIYMFKFILKFTVYVEAHSTVIKNNIFVGKNISIICRTIKQTILNISKTCTNLEKRIILKQIYK